MDEIIRETELAKIDDDNYVFIRRSVNPKARHRMQKREA